MSCGRFLKSMGRELKHQSSDDEMCSPFPLHPVLLDDDWRKGQEWLVLNSQFIMANKTETKFIVPSSVFLATSPSVEKVKEAMKRWKQKVQPIKGETFDEYTFRRGSFFLVSSLKASLLQFCYKY